MSKLYIVDRYGEPRKFRSPLQFFATIDKAFEEIIADIMYYKSYLTYRLTSLELDPTTHKHTIVGEDSFDGNNTSDLVRLHDNMKKRGYSEADAISFFNHILTVHQQRIKCKPHSN